MTIKRINRGKGHSYTIDGARADGVTTLLGKGIARPALINWAANTTANYAIDRWAELSELTPSARLKKLQGARYEDLDQAGRRGTEIHAIAEQLVQGKQVDIPEPLAGHVESYIDFLNTFEPEPLLVEGVVANRKWRYCGTLDLVARIDGEVWILDVKTARSGIFPDVALQVAGYRWAEVHVGADGEEHPMSELGITRGGAIHVRADGFSLVPLDTSESVFKDLLHVIWCARMTERWDEWRGDAVQQPVRREEVAS